MIGRPAVQPSVVHCLRQVMLGNNDVARCDLVCRQSGFKRHLPGRLPNDADDCASISGDVVQLVPKSHWLIADRMDGVMLASLATLDRPRGARIAR